MHSPKICSVALFGSEPLFDLFIDAIFVQLSSPVLSQACYTRLRGIPVALSVEIEVSGLVRETAQSIAESGNALPWLHTAKLDLAIGQSFIGITQIRGGTQVDRACYTPTGGVAA